MKLYFFPGACSLAVHAALHHVGIRPELVQIDPITNKTLDGKPLTEISPKGYVPIAIDEDGEVLTEVVAIMLELDSRYPAANLIPKSGKPRREAIEWLAYISSELHRQFILPLFLEGEQTEEVKAARAKVERRLGYAAANLTGPYFLGETLSVVDFFMMVMMFWTGPSKVNLAQWPEMIAYRDRLVQVPAIHDAMKAEGLV
ncbi:MAG: glutathione S-transferase N-terminal domain-containing protein [Thalassospira sp.]|uniref:glutathione binding-like protein n=1 Tax=Thalassospira sp. TaxID=1912094 RepID=UPI0032EAACC4